MFVLSELHTATHMVSSRVLRIAKSFISSFKLESRYNFLQNLLSSLYEIIDTLTLCPRLKSLEWLIGFEHIIECHCNS